MNAVLDAARTVNPVWRARFLTNVSDALMALGEEINDDERVHQVIVSVAARMAA